MLRPAGKSRPSASRAHTAPCSSRTPSATLPGRDRGCGWCSEYVVLC
ncbi:hypothetical protein SFR_2760 [Streptomyces sp. FR-008]|nr:hypothetical protein SFR_2760 [Streptomyces sp. FR-008]